MARSALLVRLMAVIAATLLLTAVALAVVLRQQTVAQFYVYRSSQEQLERLAVGDRAILTYYATRIAEALADAEREVVADLTDRMAAALGHDVVVARNDDRFYPSDRLRRMELSLKVDRSGLLVARVEDPRRGVQADLEIAPIMTREITPFTVEHGGDEDLARFYGIPSLVAGEADLERRFVSRTTRAIVLFTGGATLIMIVLIGAVLARSLRPVRRLTAAANELRHGGDPEPVAARGTREIEELARAFNEMARTIRDEQQSRRRLLADISHELRGPLANLRAQLEAMQDGLLEAAPSAIASLHEDTMLLARLVEDLHQLTLADSRALTLDMHPVAPADIVRAAVAPLESACTANRVRLVVHVPEDLPTVHADAQRMAQVVRNVLQNAIRYAADGTVTVGGVAREERVRLEIADTGAGVPEEELERIFDRFYRPDPSRTRASGGSGLGLAIARAIVESHRGSIGARANDPHGLLVWIELPQADARSDGSDRSG